MFGNIMGAMFFVVVALLPKGRKADICSVVEGGMPYIWDRCQKPDLFRGQRPSTPNVIWGVTYPATYVRGERYPFIGEDLGMWQSSKFVELCQYGSPALCVIPPPCWEVMQACTVFTVYVDDDLPFVEFAARMGCEEADEMEELPKRLSSHRASLAITGEWDHCRHCRGGRWHTGTDTNRMTRDRARQSARRIKAEVQSC